MKRINLEFPETTRFTSEAAANLINPTWNKHDLNMFLIHEGFINLDLQLLPPHAESGHWEEVYHYYDKKTEIGCMVLVISAEMVLELQKRYKLRYGKEAKG